MLKNLKIRAKLIMLLLIMGIVPVAVISIISYNIAASRMERQAFNQLESVHEIKTYQISHYFDERMKLLDDVQISFRYKNGLTKFGDAFKSGLESNKYKSLVEKYEKGFQIFMDNFGFYDVFLISPSGDVIYTVAKEADLGVNLTDSKWSSTGLGKAFLGSQEGKVFIDFAWYDPSNEPASFIAVPIRDQNDKYIGSAAFQISLTDINEIMQNRAGMGETGETYLVGPDMTMRSDSYLDPTGRSVKASFAGTVERNGVNTKATREVFAGREGEEIIIDYNGNPVLSVYKPIKIFGSITWAIIAEIDEAEAFEASYVMLQYTLIFSLIFAAGICVIGYFFASSISKPIVNTVEILKEVANGDLTKSVTIDSKNELGELSNSMNSFIESLHGIISKLRNNGDAINGSTKSLSSISTQLLSSLEDVTSQSATVASATEEVSSNMSSMAATAEEMSINVENVVNNATQVSDATISVANSIEEVSSTVNTIASNSREAADISDQAARMSSEASETMVTLGEAANEIGKVTEVIKRIADQTNLLALNATIEAASAGEAGKGFAVVANEIKELANQSARAAEDIADKISSVQDNTNNAVGIIEKVAEIILTINNSVNEISSSVDQQSVTITEVATSIMQTQNDMKELANNVEEVSVGVNDLSKSTSEAAKGTDDVAASITMVNDATISNNEGAQNVMKSVETLTSVASDLVEIVEKFKLNKN
ncbi:MAG: methyl-accepting chemotaxis protein [Rhodothermaceae bacterium]